MLFLKPTVLSMRDFCLQRTKSLALPIWKQRRAQIPIPHAVFLDLQLLWHRYPKVWVTVIPEKKMSPNITNQYRCLDTPHLPRCFAGIPRRSSKKGKCKLIPPPRSMAQAAPLRRCYDDCSQQSSSAEAFVFSTLHHLQGASFTTLINEKTR